MFTAPKGRGWTATTKTPDGDRVIARLLSGRQEDQTQHDESNRNWKALRKVVANGSRIPKSVR